MRRLTLFFLIFLAACSQPQRFNLEGVWNVSGNNNVTDKSFSLVANLNQEGRDLTGNFIIESSGTSGSLSGTVLEEQLELVLLSSDGLSITIEAMVYEDDFFYGNYEASSGGNGAVSGLRFQLEGAGERLPATWFD